MDESFTTDHDESAAESEPKSSAESEPRLRPQPTKTQKPSADAKPKAAPKKTSLTPKSTGSLSQSKNLPPSALLAKATTDISANGGGGEINPNLIVKMIELRLLKAIGDGPQVQAAFAAKMAEIRSTLGAGNDPIEALLIERIVLCWARIQYVEAAVSGTCERGTAFEQADHWDKRLSNAQGRFLKACLSLERVRKLRRRPPMSGAAISALMGESRTLGELVNVRLKK